MAEDDRSIEIESLKKMSKEYYQKNVELKKEVKELQEQVIGIFGMYKVCMSQKIERTLPSQKAVDDLIAGAEKELVVITPILDRAYLGKLIDKSKKVKVNICTLDKGDVKDKVFHEALKLLKSEMVIKSVTNSNTNALVLIRDKTRSFLSTGSLTEESLNEDLNIGYSLSNRNDVNHCIRFANAHFPSFMQMELAPQEETQGP